MTIRQDPLGFLESMRDEFGDVVQFPIPRPPTYLINSAEGAQRVLVGNARNYGKGTIQYRSLSLVTGEALLTAEDAAWRQQRPVVQPAFHRGTLSSLEVVVIEETAKTVDRWLAIGRESIVDVEAAMMDLTLRVVGRTLFGDDLGADSAVLADATLAALEVVIKRSRVPIPIPRWMPTPANRSLQRITQALERAVDRLIRNRRAQPPDPGAELMLDMLLASPTTSPALARDQIVTFLVAGHETAASALTWGLWLLARHPPVQQRLADSRDSSSSGYLNGVVDEVLRLYPPAWVITRQALGDDEIDGCAIPESSLVIVSPYLLQRDARYWPDPLVFDPDRSAAGPAARRPAYLPFGAGPRLCIGRDFAHLEMSIVLAELSRNFQLAPARPGGVRAMPQVTLRPEGGMRLRLAPAR